MQGVIAGEKDLCSNLEVLLLGTRGQRVSPEEEGETIPLLKTYCDYILIGIK